MEKKLTGMGGQSNAPGGASLVNCIATSDFRVKTTIPFHNSATRHFVKKEKRKRTMTFFKPWLTTSLEQLSQNFGYAGSFPPFYHFLNSLSHT